MGTKPRSAKMNSELVEFKAVITELKAILRKRKISYAELADQLGLSESGVKKIFASSDCSYSRLSQISRALGIRLADLLVEIDQAESKKVQFSQKQQEFLLRNPRAFNLFIKLVVERHELKDIVEEFRVSEKETFGLLRKLDELNLIQLLPGNRIKLPPLRLVRNFGDGPLMKSLYKNWGERIVRELAHPENQETGNFIVRSLRLKEDSYSELLDRLLELENEFLKRAVREMSVHTKGLKTVRWMWLTDDRSYIRDSL